VTLSHLNGKTGITEQQLIKQSQVQQYSRMEKGSTNSFIFLQANNLFFLKKVKIYLWIMEANKLFQIMIRKG